MNGDCKHGTMIPVYLHAGGELVISFEGRPLQVEALACAGCGAIRLQVRYPALFATYLKERTQDRRQT